MKTKLVLFALAATLIAFVAPTVHSVTGAAFAMPFFAWFTHIFDGIGAEFRKLMNKIKPFMQHEIPVAIVFGNAMLAIIKNPAMDFAEVLIPGDLDKMIIDRAREVLPKLLVELKLVDAASATGSNDEIIKASAEFIGSIVDPKKMHGKIREMVIYLADVLADGKMTSAELVHGVQIAFDKGVTELAVAA